MTKMIKDNLKSIIEENRKLQEELSSLENNQLELEYKLNQIYSANSYKLWQKFNKIKKLLLAPVKFINYLIRPIIFYTKFEFKKIFIKKTELRYKKENYVIDGISFIIPTWNKEEMVVRCIDNLNKIITKECTDIDKEIIIVDNGSKDNTVKSINKLKSKIPIRIIKLKTNLGFGEAVNIATKKSKFNYIYLLNNDMFPKKRFLSEIIEFAQKLIKNNKPFFGLSSQIFFYDPTKRREESGKTYITPKFGFINIAHCVNEANLIDNSITAYPGGGSSLLNKYVFDEIGFYDYKSYKPLYCEDLDSGFVAWKLGFPSYYIANSYVVHHHRSSSKQLSVDPDFMMHKNWLTFILKNVSDRSLYLNHIFSYSLLCTLDKKYREYSDDVFKNINNILNSKLHLARFINKYQEKELINFVEFETKNEL